MLYQYLWVSPIIFFLKLSIQTSPKSLPRLRLWMSEITAETHVRQFPDVLHESRCKCTTSTMVTQTQVIKHFTLQNITREWLKCKSNNNILPFYKYFWGADRKSVLLFTAEAYLPVAMQVRGSRWARLMGPHPPLCVIQSPVIGGGKEKRPTSQWLSHTVRKKELGLGTDFGNACQLMSSSLDGSFGGQCGGEVLLYRQTGSYIHALHYCIMNVYLLLLEMIIRRKPCCLYENDITICRSRSRDRCHCTAFDQLYFPLHH